MQCTAGNAHHNNRTTLYYKREDQKRSLEKITTSRSIHRSNWRTLPLQKIATVKRYLFSNDMVYSGEEFKWLL